MSRVVKNPIVLPAGVDVKFEGKLMTVKGSKGSLCMRLHDAVQVTKEENVLRFTPVADVAIADAIAGTTRAITNNMVSGVTKGYERKLILVGVGYRAQMKGKMLALTLGFSHPVEFIPPEGITIETPSQTEILVKGSDKQVVGQVAANIRAFRPPEPYKGKGVKYADEFIVLKEGKKK